MTPHSLSTNNLSRKVFFFRYRSFVVSASRGTSQQPFVIRNLRIQKDPMQTEGEQSIILQRVSELYTCIWEKYKEVRQSNPISDLMSFMTRFHIRYNGFRKWVILRGLTVRPQKAANGSTHHWLPAQKNGRFSCSSLTYNRTDIHKRPKNSATNNRIKYSSNRR